MPAPRVDPLLARAARADLLAGQHPASAVLLRFAAGLFRAQAAIVARLLDDHRYDPFSGELERDAGRLLAALGPLFSHGFTGPQPELCRARALEAAEAPATALRRLLTVWQGDGRGDWLTRAQLRIWLSLLEAAQVPPHRPDPTGPGHCPHCSGPPALASRRVLPETDGASRFLHCSLCGGEWRAGRIQCVACGEADPHKLPVFDSPGLAGARVEACETCGRYLKSIDLTQDARRLPEVDDLATVALDLWAEEQGLVRAGPGLLGGE